MNLDSLEVLELYLNPIVRDIIVRMINFEERKVFHYHLSTDQINPNSLVLIKNFPIEYAKFKNMDTKMKNLRNLLLSDFESKLTETSKLLLEVNEF